MLDAGKRRIVDLAWRSALMPHRVRQLCRYEWPRVRAMASWLVRSRETTNFTYDITDRNLCHLADFLSVVTGCTPDQVAQFLSEPPHDSDLLHHCRTAFAVSPLRARPSNSDSRRVCEACFSGRKEW